MIRDHVAEDAAHVGDNDRRRREFRIQVFLHARRRRLCPAQLRGRTQHGGRQIPEQGVRVGDLTKRSRFVGSLNDGHWAGRRPNASQAVLGHGGMKQEFHGKRWLTGCKRRQWHSDDAEARLYVASRYADCIIHNGKNRSPAFYRRRCRMAKRSKRTYHYGEHKPLEGSGGRPCRLPRTPVAAGVFARQHALRLQQAGYREHLGRQPQRRVGQRHARYPLLAVAASATAGFLATPHRLLASSDTCFRCPLPCLPWRPTRRVSEGSTEPLAGIFKAPTQYPLNSGLWEGGLLRG